VLILAATPIGNLSDSSARLIELLTNSSTIAAEDTRTVLKLAQGLGIQLKAKLVSLHEHNEAERVDQILDLANGGDVLLVTDAGMPTISDPGFVLVRAAIERGIEITIAPGPSAVLAALAVSGLATDRFSFEGFIPRKDGERKEFFGRLVDQKQTMIFFDSPHRIHDSLKVALEIFGKDRQASLSRELTKKFEETFRGSLAELVSFSEKEIKGELVLCIAGNTFEAEVDYSELIELVEALKNSGKSLKEAVSIVANLAKVSKSELYDQTIQSREE
jgi:16S rRNA (cytidine1402-2'-O)-methyltransferase